MNTPGPNVIADYKLATPLSKVEIDESTNKAVEAPSKEFEPSGTQTWGVPEQAYPSSSRHSEEQPSKSSMFPSSHSSLFMRTLSPHLKI